MLMIAFSVERSSVANWIQRYAVVIFKVINLLLFLQLFLNHYSIKLVNKRDLAVPCILQQLIKLFFGFGQSCGHKNKIGLHYTQSS